MLVSTILVQILSLERPVPTDNNGALFLDYVLQLNQLTLAYKLENDKTFSEAVVKFYRFKPTI